MSNNQKPTQYLIKAPANAPNAAPDVSSVPPRYQPPPQPPGHPGPPGGILKPLAPNAQRDGPLKSQRYHADPKQHPQGTKVAYPGPSRPPAQSRPSNVPSRLSDDELLRLGPVEMLKFVRKTEGDSARSSAEQARHLQGLSNELRALKEDNQRLSDDNQELRDLCCFLDDDRQKGRKLAREWQRFGRYTASVMRQEVSAYQSKLRQLDDKQQELIRDNLELKELCLYLDEERGGSGASGVCMTCGAATGGVLRDDGDGSSSSTNADDPLPLHGGRERLLSDGIHRHRSAFSDQTMQYVRSLERRVQQLEEERRALQSPSAVIPETLAVRQAPPADPLTGRPEAVVRALQVLEVREQLERERAIAAPDVAEHMDDGEKALVREMCNVVWRKLEECPPATRDM